MSRLSSWNIRIIVAIPFLLGVWGFFVEPRQLLTHREVFSAPEHPWHQEPLKIVLFSDLHAGSPWITEAYIEKLVERVNREEPDLVLMAGDFSINGVLGGKPIPIEKLAKSLSHMKAKKGIFAVLGNHDWWNDGPGIRLALEKNSIHVLENEARLITYGISSKFQLIGIGDDHTEHANTALAFKNTDARSPRLVLTHDPSTFLDFKEKFDIGFAGHTHGGQVYIPFFGPPIIPSRAPRSWARGWVKDHESRQLFITQGVGTSILPVRFNAPPEIVVLEFKP